MATGYLVKIDPEGKVERLRISNRVGPTVEELQKCVGGHFTIIHVVYEGRKRMAYIDEDARIKRPTPPVNPEATKMVQAAHLMATVDILGPIAVWVPDVVTLRKSDAVV